MSSLKGNLSTLRNLSKALERLPFWAGREAARAAAPAITRAAQQTFDAGKDPYGVTWEPSRRTGEAVDLNESGAMRAQMYYVPIGTKLRVALGMPYAKYQIGRRRVFPSQGGALPASYVEAISAAANIAILREMEAVR